MSRKRNRLSRRQRRIKNRVTYRTVFLLAITLIFNTYAWFTYITTVSADLRAHVDAWHVEFEVDSQTVDQEFEINIDHAYPGMANQNKTVRVINTGEKAADITYKIKSARIFNEQFISSEAVAAGATVPTGATVLTEAQLLTRLQSSYPFHLSFTLPDATLDVEESGTLTIGFTWAFGTGVAAEDALDTSYGTMSYNYMNDPQTASNSSIQIVLTIGAEQHRDGVPTSTPTPTPTP